MASIEARPNIRIEFQNNLIVPMDVDNDENANGSDLEEGQLSDKAEIPEEAQVKSKPNNRIWSNNVSGFTTGVNIFDEEEQSKLQERANRFGLKPTEIKNFTDEQLQKLHNSLGISAENEKTIRFEAIHMRGTDDMSTEHVFEYFGKYVPSFIEWVNDESCNVVWTDKISAARALHFTSLVIKGMPVEGPCDPFIKEITEDESNRNDSRSILLINKEREVELQRDETQTSNTEMEEIEGSVSISDINVPIPPGYWRLGVAHPKAKCILLRFAYKTDKKPLKAEKFSEYYKKYGNPNFGGLRGIITESKRNQIKGIFDRNKDIKISEDTKNPWGDLAENWSQDERFSETLPVVTENKVQRQIVNSNVEKSNILQRLGVKRTPESDSDSSSEEKVIKKSKVPRMRMYADEEEEKIKRKKQLLGVKLQKNVLQNENVRDLRKMIGNKPKRVEQIAPVETIHHNNDDLGTKLKNRTRTQIRELPVLVPDQRARIESRSTLRRPHNDQPTTSSRLHADSEERHIRQKRERQLQHSSHGESSKKRYRNKLQSDRYERKKLPLDDDIDQNKTRSKVAVVIKTQKRPTVASTIWSRIALKKERLKTASERLQPGNESSSSSESSSDSDDSSSESTSDVEEETKKNNTSILVKQIDRPGFNNNNEQASGPSKNKSPLRIEINNDHFKEE